MKAGARIVRAARVVRPFAVALLVGGGLLLSAAPHASAGAAAATGVRVPAAAPVLVSAPSYASAAARAPKAPGLGVAAGHPLGNFTVNRYDGLVTAPGELRVDHVEDLAEIPAAQVQSRVDAQGLPAWAEERCRRAVAAMRITVDGRVGRPMVRSASAQSRAGQAGLPTLRVECRITASADGTLIVFRDNGIAGPIGWHEITAQGDRTTLTATDVPATSRSVRLTKYPQDMLSSPLDVRAATLRVRPGGPPLAQSPGVSGGTSTGTRSTAIGGLPRGADRLTQSFTDLVAHRRLSVGFAALALVIALALGSMHALAPGHGKTIMAAYAVGSGVRARRDVLTLGVTVTVTHTAGVLALGLLIASGTALAPTVVYPWLGIASGVLVAVSGAVLLRRAFRTRRNAEHHGHGHGHAHGYGHGHPHDDHPAGAALGRGGAALMGFAGGLVPSPSAVLVLVGAAAIGQAGFGVALVLAYGAGLACTLILIGLFVVGSGRWLAQRLTSSTGGRRLTLARAVLPLGSAACVVLLGLGLVLRSLPGALA